MRRSESNGDGLNYPTECTTSCESNAASWLRAKSYENQTTNYAKCLSTWIMHSTLSVIVYCCGKVQCKLLSTREGSWVHLSL